jgi:hypothetical protein
MAFGDLILPPAIFTGTDIRNLINTLFTLTGGTSGGSANVQTITMSSNVAALETHMQVRFFAGFSNTSTTPTINVNSLGAKTVKYLHGAALTPGAIQIGKLHVIVYDGTDWLLLNPYTSWQTWSPTVSASASMTVTAQTNRESKYRVDGNGKHFEFETTVDGITLGGTASISLYIPLPVAAVSHHVNAGFMCVAVDNGTQVTNGGRYRVENTPRISLFKPGAANWTLGANTSFSIKGSGELG